MEGGIHFIDFALYFGLFLLVTAGLQIFSNKISFPYTVTLLIAGLLTQFLVHTLHLDVHIALPPEFIFFFLLPMLLFEAAMHINIHQFRLQFKTISFLATFGLLLSVFTIGFGLAWLLNMPLGVALLFGGIISATDPIAVLALFKTLGAPKRLALVADGESMFNDATGVIAFRVISTFVVGNAVFGPQKLLPSVGDFIYIFVGSIILGSLIGYIFARILQKIPTERIIITAVTTAIAIGGFAAAEHFLRLSGVITTVMAGIVFGNLAIGKMHARVIHFLEEYWEYLVFLSLSLVFFFATYQLDVALFTQELGIIAIVIAVVLIARAVSVYVTAFLSNTLPFFKDEPNIPLKWLHILNWGGLRGVIPLVLVYSLPEEFAYKEQMLRFTLAALLFTLFVNGLTIKSLLIKLKLHLPKKEEEIISDEIKLFELDEMRQKLASLPTREFDQKLVKEIDLGLQKKEEEYKRHLLKVSTPEEFLQSLKIEALEIERGTLKRLYEEGRMTESVYYTFDSELDLQQDALEYPEVFKGRAMKEGGFVSEGRTTFRKRLLNLQKFISRYKVLSSIFGIKSTDLIKERYSLLRARLFTSYAVLDYLERVEKILAKSEPRKAIEGVRKMQHGYIAKNKEEIKAIDDKYPRITREYQQNVIRSIITQSSSGLAHSNH